MRERAQLLFGAKQQMASTCLGAAATEGIGMTCGSTAVRPASITWLVFSVAVGAFPHSAPSVILNYRLPWVNESICCTGGQQLD